MNCYKGILVNDIISSQGGKQYPQRSIPYPNKYNFCLLAWQCGVSGADWAGLGPCVILTCLNQHLVAKWPLLNMSKLQLSECCIWTRSEALRVPGWLTPDPYVHRGWGRWSYTFQALARKQEERSILWHWNAKKKQPQICPVSFEILSVKTLRDFTAIHNNTPPLYF